MPKPSHSERDEKSVVGGKTYEQLWQASLRPIQTEHEAKCKGYLTLAELERVLGINRRTLSDQLRVVIQQGRAKRIEVRLDSGRIGFAYRPLAKF